MRPLSAIVVHKDQAPAQLLAESLRQHLRFVSTAINYNEACEQVRQYRAQLLILDLETLSLDEIKKVRDELPGIAIVCTHRAPDDRHWTEVLETGALDCCLESDIRAIVLAADRHTGTTILGDASNSAVA
jgi:DNA-binding response OmpR family regulator